MQLLFKQIANFQLLIFSNARVPEAEEIGLVLKQVGYGKQRLSHKTGINELEDESGTLPLLFLQVSLIVNLRQDIALE